MTDSCRHGHLPYNASRRSSYELRHRLDLRRLCTQVIELLDCFLGLYLTPLPGTILYDQYKKENRITVNDYEKYDFKHLVFRPRGLSEQEMFEGISWITKSFYHWKHFLGKARYMFWDYLKHPSYRRLFRLIALIAIYVGFRNRLKDLTNDGTFQ